MKSIVSPIPVAILLGALVFVPTLQAFAAAQTDPVAKKKVVPVSQKKKTAKTKEVPVRVREVARPIELPAKTSGIREVPAKTSEIKIKQAVGVDSKGKLIIQERTADDLVKSGTLIRERTVSPNTPTVELPAKARSANPVSEIPISNMTPPYEAPPSVRFPSSKNSKDYLLYQIGQEIESLLEQRQSLLHMLRTGELYILDKEMQIEAHRKHGPGEDKDAQAHWEKDYIKMRSDLQTAQASSELLESKLKVNEAKLADLRKKLDEANK